MLVKHVELLDYLKYCENRAQEVYVENLALGYIKIPSNHANIIQSINKISNKKETNLMSKSSVKQIILEKFILLFPYNKFQFLKIISNAIVLKFLTHKDLQIIFEQIENDSNVQYETILKQYPTISKAILQVSKLYSNLELLPSIQE